jgi:hypothetical protein
MNAFPPKKEAELWPPDISVVVANVKYKEDGWSGIRLAHGEWKQCPKGNFLLLPSGGAA